MQKILPAALASKPVLRAVNQRIESMVLKELLRFQVLFEQATSGVVNGGTEGTTNVTEMTET